MNTSPASVAPALAHVTTPSGVRVSYERSGTGPPLVLVHGGFSNHLTNWELVKPLWRPQFTVYAVARRGRGETDCTQGHSLEDEATDLVAIIRQAGVPVSLLGHSYGAQVALAAARRVPDRVQRLVLYEPPWPAALKPEFMARLEALATARQWDALADTFFSSGLSVPRYELDGVRASDAWAPIVADARASMGDLRALVRYRFDADAFRTLTMPVLLQIGSESRHALYVTEALTDALADVRVRVLVGQAHEAMTTAPEMYAGAVATFLQR